MGRDLTWRTVRLWTGKEYYRPDGRRQRDRSVLNEMRPKTEAKISIMHNATISRPPKDQQGGGDEGGLGGGGANRGREGIERFPFLKVASS